MQQHQISGFFPNSQAISRVGLFFLKGNRNTGYFKASGRRISSSAKDLDYGSYPT